VRYENDEAPYAIANLHLETDDATCYGSAIVQRERGRPCWSFWRGPERSEPDPVSDRFAVHASTPRDQARLVINDLFHRWTFPTPYGADCRRTKPGR
jgi:hypothetical protein